MNIALIGFGKMGKLLEARAIEKNHRVLMIVDPYFQSEKSLLGTIVSKSLETITSVQGDLDAAIEFSRPDTAVENLLYLARNKIPAVTGTTGWYDKLPEVNAAVMEAGTSLFWAPNFSLGMNLFYRIASFTAGIFDPFPEYDVGGLEIHHNKKADSPSGTARIIANKILEKMTRKNAVIYEKYDGPPAPDELHFASLRIGSVPGVHSITFDSPADTVEITHTLRNREGLAAGALKSAEWLCSQKRCGVFTMDDMLTDILQEYI